MILDNIVNVVARATKDIVNITTGVGTIIIDEISSIPKAAKDGYKDGLVSSLLDDKNEEETEKPEK